MAQDVRTSIRLPDDLMRRVRRVRDAMNKAGKGLTYTDSSVIRGALVRGLEVLEEEAKARRHVEPIPPHV